MRSKSVKSLLALMGHPGMPARQQEMQQQQGFEQWPFANNSATGPGVDTAVGGGGALVPWATIASGAAAGNTVPCTPKVTGRFVITFAVLIANTTGAAINAQIQLQQNGANVANAIVQATVPLTTGVQSITGQFVATAAPGLTPQTFGLNVTGNGVTIKANNANITIQEVDVATG